MAMDLLCQEIGMRAWTAPSRWVSLVHCGHSARKVLLRKSKRNGCLESQFSQQWKPFSHCGRACDTEEVSELSWLVCILRF